MYTYPLYIFSRSQFLKTTLFSMSLLLLKARSSIKCKTPSVFYMLKTAFPGFLLQNSRCSCALLRSATAYHLLGPEVGCLCFGFHRLLDCLAQPHPVPSCAERVGVAEQESEGFWKTTSCLTSSNPEGFGIHQIVCLVLVVRVAMLGSVASLKMTSCQMQANLECCCSFRSSSVVIQILVTAVSQPL